MKPPRAIVPALILSLLLLTPVNIFSCGPFFTEAIFVSMSRPAPSINDYLAGHLGVVAPTYYRVYLAIAYRVLSGKPIEGSQIVKAMKFWSYDRVVNAEDDSAIRQWKEARSDALGEKPSPPPDSRYQVPDSYSSYRHLADYFNAYMNCTPDAYRNAAVTIEDRARHFGPASATIREWVAAQDAVFSNCAKNGVLPNAAANADPLIKADRSYQLAAAHFYREEFKDARMGFIEIANDHASPWHTIAPYLAARTLIRQATLSTLEDKPAHDTLLAQAETELRVILADKNATQIHPAIERTLGFVEFRLHPGERLHVLASRVAGIQPSADLGQDLIDYIRLLPQAVDLPANNTVEREASADRQAAVQAATSDDITDWVLTAASSDAKARIHALERWQQTHSVPWLIVALAKTNVGDADLDGLLRAAAVPDNSLAHDSATFQRARLLVAIGRKHEARALLDQELQLVPSGPNQTRNLYLGLRWRLARNLDEFLKFAPQVPVVYDDGTSFLGGMYCNGDNCNAMPQSGPPKMSALFDLPVAATLNQRIPLPLLMKAAQNRSLPENLRHALLTATWARSAVLGNSAQARALGPQLGQEFPELVKYVSEYNSSPDDSSREFAAVFAMLHFPGVRPYVNAGVLREAPLAKIDDFRDNWWGEDVGGRPGTQNFAKGCGAWREWRERITAAGSGQAGPPAKTLNPDWPSFLSSKERNAADSDWNRLQHLGPAPNYFGRVVLAWAKAHREDPRVPEALHLVVRSSRYGCNNRETGLFSRQAFELLHRRYPNSEWANKTTHWFE